MSEMQLVSIITPCFNEEANVDAHFARVCAAIAPYRDRFLFEHIYTDNDSRDGTFTLLTALAAKYENVRVLRFSRNIGADRAIQMGLEQCRGEAAILIQADLQDPPELLPTFLDGWIEGFDVVFGVVRQRAEGLLMRSLRRLYYWIIDRLSDVPIPQGAGEFRLMSRRALDALLQFQEHGLYIRGAVAIVGFPQRPILYDRQPRAGGRSSVNFLYLISYALNGLVSTTIVPIRLVSICGVFFSALGFLLTLVLIVAKLLRPDASPHGFTTLASMMTFFAGVQILGIGIIGEYVCKTYLQSVRRPRGFVRDRINFGG